MNLDKANLTSRVLAHIAPCRSNWELAKKLEKLQETFEKLQKSSEANPPAHTEAALLRCAGEIIMKGTTMYEATLAAESVAGGQGAANKNVGVAEWVNTLESISWDQRHLDPSDLISNIPSIFSGDDAHSMVTSATSAQRAVQERETIDAIKDDSDDELDIDLAKAALDTGTKAFEKREWEEADILLQEALRVLQQLPKQQRAFCDIFGLHYKLAVCTYYTQEPANAEEALMSLIQQSASTDEQREYMYNATHLLSKLYIRMGQIDRARSECEKALQARRRLLGKQSDASLESTALMAYVYFLLNNRARAKSYLALIPEPRRDAVLKTLEKSLDLKEEPFCLSASLTRSVSEDSDMAIKRNQSRLSVSSVGLSMKNHCKGPQSATISPSPPASLRQSLPRVSSNETGADDMQSVPAATSISFTEGRRQSRATEKERASEDYTTYPEVLDIAALSPGKYSEIDETSPKKILSRKEILDKVGCQPRDAIEDAVCEGNHSAFANILNSKKDFWRSKLRKRIRPERVTALHFAALFGEISMAQRLLDSRFNINEVPYGYSTRLTPLEFAVGARQVEMVEFLVRHGAQPSEPDSWSTLAGQLMNRSWLTKTMSEAEKEFLPDRIIAIMRILLEHGWDVNAPFESSGGTVLHQAVTFWMGSYKLDLNLRAIVTRFLYERGADPFKENAEGQTPYAKALASGHQDLLMILGRGSSKKELDGESDD